MESKSNKLKQVPDADLKRSSGDSCRDDKSSGKKTYHRPVIRSYGSVEERTQFGGSLMLDSGGSFETPP